MGFPGMDWRNNQLHRYRGDSEFRAGSGHACHEIWGPICTFRLAARQGRQGRKLLSCSEGSLTMRRLIFEPEHEQFRDSVRKFMQAEVGPHAERRSEERRVGKECVRTCRSGWWQDH